MLGGININILYFIISQANVFVNMFGGIFMITEKGVLYYTKGVVEIDVSFPESQVFCKWCKFAKYEHGLNRVICIITDEYILKPQIGVGQFCPIIFENKEEL